MATRADDDGTFGRAGVRNWVQILGGTVLGLGLASTLGLDPSALFAAYTVGLGLTLLVIAWLMSDGSTSGPTDGPVGRAPSEND